MNNSYFFKNLDRSESLESFISQKMNRFRFKTPNARWIISKDHEEFTVQCILGNKHFQSSNKDPYKASKQIIESIKSHHYNLRAS